MNNSENTKKEITLDDLALMVAKGFNEINEKMDKRFREVAVKIEETNEKMDRGFREAKTEREDIGADINKKVDKIEHNTLTYRVEKLEKKFA